MFYKAENLNVWKAGKLQDPLTWSADVGAVVLFQ